MSSGQFWLITFIKSACPFTLTKIINLSVVIWFSILSLSFSRWSVSVPCPQDEIERSKNNIAMCLICPEPITANVLGL